MKRTCNIWCQFSKVIILLVAFSCTEDIDLKLKGHGIRMLVVEGQITSDTTTHWVQLSYSADYFDNRKERVENAVVSISDGTKTFQLHEASHKQGLFLTAPDVYGIPGNTYTLTISGIDTDEDGETETYQAISTMPSDVIIDSIDLKITRIFFRDVLRVSFFTTEPNTPNDAYLFKTAYNGVMITDSLFEWAFARDEMFDGMKIYDEPIFYFDQKDTQYVVKDGDVIALELSHIPLDYYYFLSAAQQEYYGANPFSGNPANISTNINGSRKAWGFFSAYYVTRKSAVFRE